MSITRIDGKYRFQDVETQPYTLSSVPAGNDGQLAVVTDQGTSRLFIRQGGNLIPANDTTSNILNPVISRIADPPGSHTLGDRYLIIATASGVWLGHETQIAEWANPGPAWVFTIPASGNIVPVTAEENLYMYDGVAWHEVPGTLSHHTLTDLTNYDDHTQYLNTDRHDTTTRHTLGSVVPIPAIDACGAASDNTTLDASISAHGLAVKPVAPATTLMNIPGIIHGETAWSNKALFDSTAPAALGSSSSGSQVIAARRDHIHANPALDTLASPTDNTTLDATTSAHGLVVKPVAPAVNLMNVPGIVNGETAWSNKALFDSTNPAALGSIAPGTTTIAAHRDHVHANPALDTLASPTDITTLNATTSAHGLVVKPVAPAANLMNIPGIVNGETAWSNKALFDAITPSALGTAAAGTQVKAAHRDHVHAMPAHSSLLTLTADDHTQYALLAGRSGGQTLDGGTLGSDNLTLQSTSLTGWSVHDPYSLGNAQWRAIASSSDGSHLATMVQGGKVYTSTDYGTTWTVRDPASIGNANYYAIASDSDGSNLIACVQNGKVYTSTDYGVTWTERNPGSVGNVQWYCAASNATGSILIVGRLAGNLYVSTDSGSTWTARDPTGAGNADWGCVASDSTGTYLVAGVNTSGKIYTSGDSGATWTVRDPASVGNVNWSSVASSSNGANLIACAIGHRVYTSTDYGVTWTAQNPGSRGDAYWIAVASDATGTHLMASVYDYTYAYVYISSDSGTTWTELDPTPTGSWYSLASDSTGTYLAAAAYTGKIYTKANVKGVISVIDTLQMAVSKTISSASGPVTVGVITTPTSGFGNTNDTQISGNCEVHGNFLTDGYIKLYNITAIKTSAYPAIFCDLVRCDPSSGGFTITLPAASVQNGGYITVKNVTSSTNVITITGAGSDLIDGTTNATISDSRKSLTFIAISGGWIVI